MNFPPKADEIIGTAVLSDKSPHDGYEYLFVICCSPSRKTVETAAIPIIKSSLHDVSGKGWKYTERGDFLDCSPSLKMTVPVDWDNPNGAQKEIFHNQGSWSVKFVRSTLDDASNTLHRINHDLVQSLREKWKATP